MKSGPVWVRDDIIKWAKKEELPLANVGKLEGSPKKVAERRARIVAMMNMKGGVGKSTIVMNLGWYATHERDRRVLLVDLDPQFNLSQYVLGTAGYEQLVKEKRPTIEFLFRDANTDSKREAIRKVIRRVVDYRDGSCLHLLPASLELAWTIKKHSDRAHVLQHYLNEIRNEYDLIMIDCAPTESVLAMAAYFAADYVFVPVKPEFLSTIGLPLLLKSMNEFGNLHPDATVPELGGIIFNDTMDKIEHDKSRKTVRDIAAENNWPIFKNEITHSDSYPAGARAGKPIFMTEKARSNKKDELARVGEEFMQKVGL